MNKKGHQHFLNLIFYTNALELKNDLNSKNALKKKFQTMQKNYD